MSHSSPSTLPFRCHPHAPWWRQAMPGTLALLVSLGAPARASASTTCYLDPDGDGYAATGAATTVVASGAACPAGYVTRLGDCAGNDAARHPRRHEVYGDGVDNNCNGLVDEPEFIFHTDRPMDVAVPITHNLIFVVNDATSDSLLRTAPYDVGFDVTLTALDGSPVDAAGNSTGTFSLKTSPTVLYYSYDSTTRTVSFSTYYLFTQDLTAHTVHQVRVQLKQLSTGLPIGALSNSYYTVTGGIDSLSLVRTPDPTPERQWRRIDIVLLGLHEYGDGLYGVVGYRGTGVGSDGMSEADGYRYAHQWDGTVGSVNWESGWCDMFWGWVARNAVPSSDFLKYLPINKQREGFVDPQAVVSGAGSYNGGSFNDGIQHVDASYHDDGMGQAGTFYYDVTQSDIGSKGALGDFLLAEGHAGIYLGTHLVTGNIISVEGNVSDGIDVIDNGRPFVWPPPATRNFWVGHGHLNAYELGL